MKPQTVLLLAQVSLLWCFSSPIPTTMQAPNKGSPSGLSSFLAPNVPPGHLHHQIPGSFCTLFMSLIICDLLSQPWHHGQQLQSSNRGTRSQQSWVWVPNRPGIFGARFCPGTWGGGRTLGAGGTHNLFLVLAAAAVGGGQGGGAGLAVPGHVAVLGGAADGEGVDAIGVAIAVATVTIAATVPRGPDEDGAQSVAALREGLGEAAGGLGVYPDWPSAACLARPLT